MNVVYDIVGVKLLSDSLRALRPQGRLILIDSLSGDFGPLDLGPFFDKELSLKASLLKPQSNDVKAQIAKELSLKVLPLIQKQKIKPVIFKKFLSSDSMDEIQAAYKRRDKLGKIIVEVSHV